MVRRALKHTRVVVMVRRARVPTRVGARIVQCLYSGRALATPRVYI